jgi:chaperone BCS1
VSRFRESRQRYRDLGVPYHRGYLFYGPPGTGKTSIVPALAGKFGMSIYVVNLGQFTDRSLASGMNEVEQNSVILFEDIDCMKSGGARSRTEEDRETQQKTGAQKEDRNGVTLSGLLNVLDGFSAPDNVLFVMTSNQIEALDPALLRPGRIDYRLCLGKATASQKVELYRRFFPDGSVLEAQMFVESTPAETMAEFQGLLLELEQTRSAGGSQVRLEFDEEVPESIAV